MNFYFSLDKILPFFAVGSKSCPGIGSGGHNRRLDLPPSEHFYQQVLFIRDDWSAFHPLVAFVGLASIATVIVAKRKYPKIPGSLRVTDQPCLAILESMWFILLILRNTLGAGSLYRG